MGSKKNIRKIKHRQNMEVRLEVEAEIPEKTKGKTHAEESRQKTGYRQRIVERCKREREMKNGGINVVGSQIVCY